MTEQEVTKNTSNGQETELLHSGELTMGPALSLEDAYRLLNGSLQTLHGPELDEAQHLAIKTLATTSNEQLEATLLLAHQSLNGRSDELKLAALEALAYKDPESAAAVASVAAFRVYEDEQFSRKALLTVSEQAPTHVIASCLEQFDREDNYIRSIEAARLLTHLAEHSSDEVFAPAARIASSHLHAHELEAVSSIGTKLLERLGDGDTLTAANVSVSKSLPAAFQNFHNAFSDSPEQALEALRSLDDEASRSLHLAALAGLSTHESSELQLEVMNGLIAHHPEYSHPDGLCRQLVARNVESDDPSLSDAAIDHKIENLW